MVRLQFLKSAILGVAALAAAVVTAQAAVLQVQNLTFDQLGNPPAAGTKNYFSNTNPAIWYRGQPAGQSDLVYIDTPNSATTYPYPTYLPTNPPPGGNFVQADGNPDFQSVFKQDISGLLSNTTYTLGFWQAASQDAECCLQGINDPNTTEQWRVFLGNGNVILTAPAVYGGFYTVDFTGNLEADSTEMSTPRAGYVDWNYTELSFTTGANAASTQTLTFLAWGDKGSNLNLPPTLFLAGVNSPNPIPEPATLSLFGAGLAGAWLRRRAKRKA